MQAPAEGVGVYNQFSMAGSTIVLGTRLGEVCHARGLRSLWRPIIELILLPGNW
jgi:hypothetical protein